MTARSKQHAMDEAAERGYTEVFDEGSCGDNGHGSRLYLCKPGAELNRHGWPVQHATLSYLGESSGWHITFFDRETA